MLHANIVVLVVYFLLSIDDHMQLVSERPVSVGNWWLRSVHETGRWWDHRRWNDCSMNLVVSAAQSVISCPCHRLISQQPHLWQVADSGSSWLRVVKLWCHARSESVLLWVDVMATCVFCRCQPLLELHLAISELWFGQEWEGILLELLCSSFV